MTVHTPAERPDRKRTHLAAYLPGAGPTAWADPRSGSPAGFGSFERLARTAERGLFDFLLLAEEPDERPEPLTALNALAAVIEHLGLAAPVDTAFNEPYELARRFATSDHLSGGRAAWHVVTSADPRAAGNFRDGGLLDRGGPSRPLLRPAGGTLARAAEFVATAREVWDSWTPDGVSRPFAHRGRHFDIAGEFTVPRSPQGHPVVIRAGDSAEDLEFAASAADVVVTRRRTLDEGRAFYADLKGRLAGYGRDHEDLKIMSRATFDGTPESVAAEIDAFVRADAADGFVLVPHPGPGALDAFVDRVVPLLQERGAFRTEYTGATLRSHLGLPQPVWKG